MRVISVREFRDKATRMLRSRDPILVLRRGEVAGLYFPYPAKSLPLEFKRELFAQIASSIGRRLQKARLHEEEILEDFEETQKACRRR